MDCAGCPESSKTTYDTTCSPGYLGERRRCIPEPTTLGLCSMCLSIKITGGYSNCIEKCRAMDKGYAGGICADPDSQDPEQCCKCLTAAEQSFEVLKNGDCCVTPTDQDLAINGSNPLDCAFCPDWAEDNATCPSGRKCVPPNSFPTPAPPTPAPTPGASACSDTLEGCGPPGI